MSIWITKSARFTEQEIKAINEYVADQGVTRNRTVQIAVKDIVTNDTNVNQYKQSAKGGKYEKTVSVKLRGEDMNALNQYLHARKITTTDLIRGAVLHYTNKRIQIEKAVNMGLQVRTPSLNELEDALCKCVDVVLQENPKLAYFKRRGEWKKIFSYPGNIERLGRIFYYSTTTHIKEGVEVPELSVFEEALRTAYTEVYSDVVESAEIPILRRKLKLSLEIDSDICDELITNLVETQKCKLIEGSGEGGLRYNGRNYMFLKIR